MPVSQQLIRTFLLYLAVIFHITACSSGSKDSSDNIFGDEIIHGSGPDAGGEVFDVAPPIANILFPPPSALTGGDSVTVTGTAADASGIASIVVNGVAATTEDGFLTWRVRVPLISGTNTLDVVSADTLGNRDTTAATTTVVKNSVFNDPFSIALDSANNQLVLADRTLRALVTADLVTGQLTIISSASIGTGPTLNDPVGVAVDNTSSDRAIVVDRGRLALLTLDLRNGDRAILSNTTTGTGPDFQAPDQIAVDTDRNRALVTDLNAPAIYAVDLTNGNRSILSGGGNGAGPALDVPQAITIDAANNRALVVDVAPAGVAVIAIDLLTGDRSIVSNMTVGAGPNLVTPTGISIDPSSGLAIVSDINQSVVPGITFSALLSVNLANGNRTIISSPTQGIGPNFDLPLALVSDASGRSFVVDTALREVLEVDNTSGDRLALSDAGIGGGVDLASPFSIDIDRANNEALVTDTDSGALYGVSIATGERRIISDASTGTGQLPIFPISVSLQPATGSAIVVDADLPAILNIDLASGDRTVISDASNGGGDPLISPAGSALDAVNNRLLVTNPDVPTDPAAPLDPNADFVLGVDLATGDRSIVSGAGNGGGAAFGTPQSIAVDAANQIGYVVDTILDTLVAVDLNTGARSAGPVGSATPFPLITQTVLPDDEIAFQDIALRPNEAVIVDSITSSVYGFNTTSGERRIVSNVATGVGTDLQSPASVAIDPATGTIFVVDRQLFAVMAIEPVSGDRVLVSR